MTLAPRALSARRVSIREHAVVAVSSLPEDDRLRIHLQ